MLNKDPAPHIERRIYKELFKLKNVLEDKVRTHLTYHHSMIPYIYELPKVHIETVPLQVIVSAIGPCL